MNPALKVWRCYCSISRSLPFLPKNAGRMIRRNPFLLHKQRTLLGVVIQGGELQAEEEEVSAAVVICLEVPVVRQRKQTMSSMGCSESPSSGLESSYHLICAPARTTLRRVGVLFFRFFFLFLLFLKVLACLPLCVFSLRSQCSSP